MYEKTITLFNHYVSGDTHTWYATMLENVDLIADKSVIVSRLGAESKDRAVLHIKCNGDDVQGHQYLDSKAWQQSPTAGITFQSGNDFDFVIIGAWNGTSPVSDSAYENGFYNHVNATSDNVFAVSSVSRYTVIPHFEITLK